MRVPEQQTGRERRSAGPGSSGTSKCCVVERHSLLPHVSWYGRPAPAAIPTRSGARRQRRYSERYLCPRSSLHSIPINSKSPRPPKNRRPKKPPAKTKRRRKILRAPTCLRHSIRCKRKSRRPPLCRRRCSLHSRPRSSKSPAAPPKPVASISPTAKARRTGTVTRTPMDSARTATLDPAQPKSPSSPPVSEPFGLTGNPRRGSGRF